MLKCPAGVPAIQGGLLVSRTDPIRRIANTFSATSLRGPLRSWALGILFVCTRDATRTSSSVAMAIRIHVLRTSVLS